MKYENVNQNIDYVPSKFILKGKNMFKTKHLKQALIRYI